MCSVVWCFRWLSKRDGFVLWDRRPPGKFFCVYPEHSICAIWVNKDKCLKQQGKLGDIIIISLDLLNYYLYKSLLFTNLPVLNTW